MRSSDPYRSIVVFTCALVIVGVMAGVGSLSQPVRHPLLDRFDEGWDEPWKEKDLASRSNRFTVVDDDGIAVLKVESKDSASGLYRQLDIDPLTSGVLSWRWRIERSLSDNKEERTKAGDDYAARVLIVFRKHFLPWKIEAISYVWAGNDSIGSVFPSPYAKNTAIVVLRSGDNEAGNWVEESRDIVDDYHRYFGRAPKKLVAVALVVDTDNTKAEAIAWFDDLTLETGTDAVE